MYVISFVLSIAAAIFLLIVSDDKTEVAVLMPLIIIVFPVEICGMILNWKKVLKGLIAPIPIVSYILESFIGMWYAIKGLIAIFKKQDLIIGNQDDGDN